MGKEDANNIEDVYDGKLYKERFGANGFFTGTLDEAKEDKMHVSLEINMDKVYLFSSHFFCQWIASTLFHNIYFESLFSLEEDPTLVSTIFIFLAGST